MVKKKLRFPSQTPFIFQFINSNRVHDQENQQSTKKQRHKPIIPTRPFTSFISSHSARHTNTSKTLTHITQAPPATIHNTRLSYIGQLSSTPSHHHNTRFAIWNINKHAAYTGPLPAYALSNIDFLYCPEPSKRFTTPCSNLIHRLTQTAYQAGNCEK